MSVYVPLGRCVRQLYIPGVVLIQELVELLGAPSQCTPWQTRYVEGPKA